MLARSHFKGIPGMSLRDRAQKSENSCPDYKPLSGSKRCQNYEKGLCALDDHPVCEEWLRANPGGRISDPEAAAFLERFPAYRRRVEEGRYFERDWRERMRAALGTYPRSGSERGGESAEEPQQPSPPRSGREREGGGEEAREEALERLRRGEVRLPTEEEIADWRALGVEMEIVTSSGERLWLVPEYTSEDRPELTPEAFATIARCLAAFPGARIETLCRKAREESPR